MIIVIRHVFLYCSLQLMLLVVVDLSSRGAFTRPFTFKGTRLQGRQVNRLQYDHNQDTISICIFYIYFYRYNYLCLEKHAIVL
jgi:hypothetical protein